MSTSQTKIASGAWDHNVDKSNVCGKTVAATGEEAGVFAGTLSFLDRERQFSPS
jgi:hypothetical protein